MSREAEDFDRGVTLSKRRRRATYKPDPWPRAVHDGTQPTPSPLNWASDSYGKVRHSRKLCVYAVEKTETGERIVTVAARIPNPADAQLFAYAPDLLSLLKEAAELMPLGTTKRAVWLSRTIRVMAKARGYS